ncbi:MAG: class E sortase [Actinomycetota bacterium]|nr:class E sortase [Actinomycetota bacterium]
MTSHLDAVPSRPRGRAGRPLRWSGYGLIAAALVVLGFALWQYVGSNWVAQRKHADTVNALEKAWVGEDATAQTDDGVADAIIRIPRFGEDYAVPVLEGTSDDVLASGFGHFTGTAGPGEVGNYALAAHRVTHGEPLRDMPDLRAGDTVTVETLDRIYTYALVSDGDALVVPFTETWVIDDRPTNPDSSDIQPSLSTGRLLTLTTCSELFHTDDRMVAFAVLDKVKDKKADQS